MLAKEQKADPPVFRQFWEMSESGSQELQLRDCGQLAKSATTPE